MHNYTLEFEDGDGGRSRMSFRALDASGAFDHARKLAVGQSATLCDANGEICRIERAAEEEIWRVIRAV